jgi:hypothetical protein
MQGTDLGAKQIVSQSKHHDGHRAAAASIYASNVCMVHTASAVAGWQPQPKDHDRCVRCKGAAAAAAARLPALLQQLQQQFMQQVQSRPSLYLQTPVCHLAHRYRYGPELRDRDSAAFERL